LLGKFPESYPVASIVQVLSFWVCIWYCVSVILEMI